MPAGTSTELVRNGSPASTSADGDVADSVRWPGVRRGERVGAEGRHLARPPSCSARSATVVGEAVPRHVRLGSAEQQHVAAVARRGRPQLGADHDEPVLTPSRSSSIGRRAR